MRAIVLAVMAVSLAAVGCGGDKSGGGSSGPSLTCNKVQPAGFPTSAVGQEVNDTIADLEWTTLDDETGCTLGFTGHVTFINIAAGWCPPCQAETPGFQTVYEEFKGDGFVVLQAMFEGYSGAPTDTFMNNWKDEYDITFTLIPDPSNDFWDLYVPPSNTGYIPHNILVDKDGVIKYTDYGSMSENQLRTRVSALIAADPILDYEE
jgi:peroxiredoxin